MFSLRTSLPIVASLATAALMVPAASTAHAAAPAGSDADATATGPRAAVTWSGWRGVDLGTSLAAAHHKLGGTFTRGAIDGGCGYVVATRTGTLNGNVYRHPKNVGTIIVKPGIAYPLGVNQTMTAAQVTRAAKQSDYILRTKRIAGPENSHEVENRVVGPYGATLYFSYQEGSSTIDRMGLAVNRNVAVQQMEINGC